MKYKKIKQIINKYNKKYSFLEQHDIDFKIVHGDNFIGMFAAYENNGNIEKHIFINIDYIITNSKKLLKHIILHEIAHALDYAMNGGWRVDPEGNIKKHDDVFIALCKVLNVEFHIEPWYKINEPKIKKKFNHLETVKLAE
jgi:hypothetical protein